MFDENKLDSIETACTTPEELIKSEEFMKGVSIILKKVEVFDKKYIESLFIKIGSKYVLEDEEKENIKTFLSDSEVARLGQELLSKLGKISVNVSTKDKLGLSSFSKLLDKIFEENGFLKVKSYIGEVSDIVKLNLNKYKGFTDVSINLNGEIKEIYLENENLKVDSSNWEETEIDFEELKLDNDGNYGVETYENGVKIKINPKKNIIEYLEGNLAGEQLFTLDSAMDEVKKQGKRLPSNVEELVRIIDKVGIEKFPNKQTAYCYGGEEGVCKSIMMGDSCFLIEDIDTIEEYVTVVYINNYGKVTSTYTGRKNFFSVRCVRD